MAAAANFAFANRQVMTHWTRESLIRALGVSAAHAGIETLYDVCHNHREARDLAGRPVTPRLRP